MAKIFKRLKNSYNAYIKHRADYKKRGYGLDRELTLQEFADAHAGMAHSGEKHPARKIASLEVTFKRNEAATIIRRLKNAEKYENEYIDKDALKALRKKYKKAKDIYSLELTPEEATAYENERRENLLKKGIKPEETIQASARVRIFNELLDAGLSYKEADEVLYG